jgi:adenylate cyclase
MSIQAAESSWSLASLKALRGRRINEIENAANNQFLIDALEQEKREGQQIATIARTVALGIIAILLPYLNWDIGVLYYEALLLCFVLIGWAQYRFARVGQSRVELALIFLDLALLTYICIVPSPFLPVEVPNAYLYRFENFSYFFVLLAVGTLAYSWRTVWSIGTWVAGLWLIGLVYVLLFGHRMPELTAAFQSAYSGWEPFGSEMDPNDPQVPLRVQEIVIFVIVAGVLALKGQRSNQLLVRQSEIAAERANLSRYFSPNIVDVLASREHDAGAVRTQDIAVLFADIVGFTELAEKNAPEKVMELLRRYHSVMENAIFQNNGTLDKYLGDGIMATFGTPETGPNDALNALRAARQIITDMDQCSRECAERGDPQFRVSVGVHFGPVILGDIGPSRRLEFAVVGDTVNVASRLESATRMLKCRVVVSDSLVGKIRVDNSGAPEILGDFVRHEAITLRGRTEPLGLWTYGSVD